ncbi:hypothetical protein H5410_001256, partial [Solanum commersonii]
MFSSSGLEIVNYEGPKLPFSKNICQSTVQPKKHRKFPGGHCINSEKEVWTGKMIYLHVEEALGLSSSFKKYGSPWTNTVSSRVLSTKSMVTVARGIFSKPRAQISNSFCEKSKVQCPLGSTGHTKSQNLQIAKSMDWCCEECEIGKGIMSSSSGLENVHYEGPRLLASEKICQSIVQPKKHSKFPGGHQALGLSSSINKYGSPRINTIFSSVVSTKSMETWPRDKCLSKQWLILLSNIPKDEIAKSNGYLAMSFVNRKSTDVRLSAIIVGTTNHGGLAKLSIEGTNICCGVTDICLKDISRELSLRNVSNVGDEGLFEIAHGCHMFKKLDLFQWLMNR